MGQHTRGQAEVVATVLVVEDEAPIRDVLATALELDGYRVMEAATGAEALDILSIHDVSLVLLDNRLPGMSGIEVLSRIRAMPRLTTLPVLLVTGDVDVDQRVAGLEAGADDYIVKPFSLDEVVARVATKLRGQHSWERLIEDRMEARAAVTRALRRTPPTGGPSDVAASICTQLLRLPGLGAAAIIEFRDDTTGLVLGKAGDVLARVPPGQTLPAPLAGRLRTWARRGPCVDTADSDMDDLGLRGRMAWAPVGDRDDPTGLLLLAMAADASGGHGTAELAAAIDFADVVETMLGDHFDRTGRIDIRARAIVDVLSQHSFVPHFQPIARLSDGVTEGVEALTRFGDGCDPAARFHEAASLGMGIALEMATMTEALLAAARMPASNWLSLNVSAEVLREGAQLEAALASCDRAIVLELSEHDPIDDYRSLRDAVDDLPLDVLLSVDDAGSGFASLRHVLELEPAFMKLDRTWVDHIDEDKARQALIAGLRHFADETGCRLIAEGIERAPEVAVLRDLGVDLGQGFLLGRPSPAVSGAA